MKTDFIIHEGKEIRAGFTRPDGKGYVFYWKEMERPVTSNFIIIDGTYYILDSIDSIGFRKRSGINKKYEAEATKRIVKKLKADFISKEEYNNTLKLKEVKQ